MGSLAVARLPAFIAGKWAALLVVALGLRVGLECDENAQDVFRVVQTLAEQLTDLGHPVADSLRVNVQLRGDRVPSAMVQQPRTKGLTKAFGRGGRQICEWGKSADPQVLQRIRVRSEDDLREVLFGVEWHTRRCET